MLVIWFTAANTILSPFNLDQWIPVMLAIGTILKDIISLIQLDTRPSNFNEAYRGLTSAQTLADQFSVATRRLPANKEEIVSRTEDAILLSYEKMATASLHFAKSHGTLNSEKKGKETTKQKSSTNTKSKKKMKI